MIQARLCVLIAVGVAVLLSCNGGFASTRATAEGELKRYGLPLEPSTLSRYLSEGIPEDHQPPVDKFRSAERFPFQRWDLYGWIATYLGETNSEFAVPILLQSITNDLPPALQFDLDVHVAGYGGHRTWNEWDIVVREEIADFRAICAEAIARIGHKGILAHLKDYLRSMEAQVAAELSKEDPDSAYLFAFSKTCRAITALGDKAGIDTLIGFLDQCPIRAPETLIYYLRISTGQTFGPEYDQPLHLRPAEIEKWQAWWETNRTSFVIDERRVLRLISPEFPKVIPSTLREHVASAETRTQDYDGTGYGRRSAQWLELNGKNFLSELLRLVNDRDEPSRIRGEAMDWYAKFAGRSAFPTLREFATDDTRYSTNTASIHLQSKALKLVEEYFPIRVERVAKDCLGSKHSVAERAIHILFKKSENHAYLVDSFHSLTPSAQFQAIQKFVQYEEPRARNIFFDALRSDNRWLALYATQGILKFNLINELPKAAREALEAWQQDPAYLMDLASRSKGSKSRLTRYREALRLIRSNDADAAWKYWRALETLQQLRASDPALSNDLETLDTLINDARRGLDRCVQSYRHSRGRTGA